MSVLVFVLAEVLPGDIGRSILGPYATSEQVATLNHELGVDRPLPVRYREWLSGVVVGDWGISFSSKESVFAVVTSRLADSLLLAFLALAIAVPLSIAVGTWAALRRDRFTDRVLSMSALALIAMPEFVTGILLLIAFAVKIPVFPTSAQIPPDAGLIETLRHLFLPALLAGTLLFGYLMRMTREGMINALDSPYVRTAVIKGIPRSRVVTHHAFRNVLLPTVTVIGAQFGGIVGSLVVIETLFDYPGIGRLILVSATDHDLPMLEGAVLAVAIVYMTANLIADASYGVLDPRVRRQGSSVT